MNKQIYIEKLAEVTGGLPARSMDEHIMGKPNDNYSSIPIEYNLEGYLLYMKLKWVRMCLLIEPSVMV